MTSTSAYSPSTDCNTSDDCTLNETLLYKVSKILTSLIEENKKLKNYKENISKQRGKSFTSYEKPTVTINEYLNRIQKYAETDDTTIIMSLIYLDKICETSKMILTINNV